jgi:hypothetical protein
MASALQFFALCSRGKFSCFGYFLHFLGTQNRHASGPFSACVLAQKGEPYFTRAVHLPLYHAVHPVSLITNFQTKNLTVQNPTLWTLRRFIESHLRWDELKQNEYLLPEGEVKKLLAGTARTVSVSYLLESPRAPVSTSTRLPSPVPVTPLEPEPVRVMDVEGRLRDLRAQAGLMKQKYGATEAQVQP